MRAPKVPTTAAEAATILQDAKDLRDELVRRFDAGDPPTENEYQEGLNRLDYAMRSHQGLVAKEKAEAENAAAEKAQALRKKFRTEVGKDVGIVVAAQKKLVEAITTLVTAAAFTNEKRDSIKTQVARLRPADVSIDAKLPWLDEALRFGGFPVASIAALPLIRAAVHEAVSVFRKDLHPAELEWLRSLDNASGGAVAELIAIQQRLSQVDRTVFNNDSKPTNGKGEN